MNGATAVPLLKTKSPPNSVIITMTGSTQNFLRARIKAHNSRRNDIVSPRKTFSRPPTGAQSVGRLAHSIGPDASASVKEPWGALSELIDHGFRIGSRRFPRQPVARCRRIAPQSQRVLAGKPQHR